MNKVLFSKFVVEKTGFKVTELRKELLSQGVDLHTIDDIYLKGLRQEFKEQSK